MSVQDQILEWYKKFGRDLPWRNMVDPYTILVSEIMLQQTQVDRVKTYFTTWMDQYPDWEALAQASNGEVIRLWSGLGYNRRAIMLRDIACYVVEHGVPNTRDEWKKIKGIGPYTSAALSTFTKQEYVLPIDTNIRRVIGRLFLGIPYAQPSDDDEITSIGTQKLMHGKQQHDIPQALFDLATEYCKKQPLCSACPLKESCSMSKAFLRNEIATPKRMIKKNNERIRPGKKYPDRIFRGRIVKLLQTQNGINMTSIGPQIDKTFTKDDMPWIEGMIQRLSKDKMVIEKDGMIYLHP